MSEFVNYCYKIILEMSSRNYNISEKSSNGLYDNLHLVRKLFKQTPENEKIFKDWMNDRYYLQCYYNLQEKYDCGGITEEEWKLIQKNKNERRFGDI